MKYENKRLHNLLILPAFVLLAISLMLGVLCSLRGVRAYASGFVGSGRKGLENDGTSGGGGCDGRALEDAPSDGVYTAADEVKDKADKILVEFSDILPSGREELATAEGSRDAVGFKFLVENAISVIKGGRGEFASFFLLLLSSGILISLASLLEGELADVSRMGISLAVYSVLVGRILTVVGELSSSLEELNGFFSALIPITASVNLLGMSASTASVQAVGMGAAFSVFSAVSGGFLISLVGIMTVFSALSVMDGSHIGRLSSFAKRFFITVIGILSAFITACFSLQSLIAARADSMSVRTAKYAASSLIPIVGSTVSGVFSTLSGGVAYVRGIVGGGAIAVIVAVSLAPIVTLLMYKACFALAGMLAGLISPDGERFLLPLSGAIDASLAVFVIASVSYIAQLVAFLKGGAALA